MKNRVLLQYVLYHISLHPCNYANEMKEYIFPTTKNLKSQKFEKPKK